jgi:hypothetical protein
LRRLRAGSGLAEGNARRDQAIQEQEGNVVSIERGAFVPFLSEASRGQFYIIHYERGGCGPPPLPIRRPCCPARRDTAVALEST